MNMPSIFSTDDCTYVVVPMEDGQFAFNYTTKPYTRSGRQPITNGQFVMAADEAKAFVRKALGRG